jgi:hypothetical protein
VSSIVLELQRDALDKKVPLTDLLRKAYVIAKKLKIPEFEEWVSDELNGYGEQKRIPQYRVIPGQVKAWHPYHGWQPVAFVDADKEKALSSRPNGQAIAEIEHMVRDKSPDGILHMPFSGEIQDQLRKAIQSDTKITLVTDLTCLTKILNSVRNIILNWAMKLEEDGILGEGYSFTPEEKHEVEKHSYNINNFYGPVEASQIQQGTAASSQCQELDMRAVQKLHDDFKRSIGLLPFSERVRAEADAELDTIETQVKSPQPKLTIIKECFLSLRTILEGAGGDIAAGLLKQIGILF